MAGFNPNQPRDKDGEWTIASSAAWKAAGLRTEYNSCSTCGVEYKDE